MVGHHSNGEAARHKLVSVSEAYQAVVQESLSVSFRLQPQKDYMNLKII